MEFNYKVNRSDNQNNPESQKSSLQLLKRKFQFSHSGTIDRGNAELPQERSSRKPRTLENNYKSPFDRTESFEDRPKIVTTNTRRSVARAGENDFVAPVTRKTQKSSVELPRYSTPKKKRRKLIQDMDGISLKTKIFWAILLCMFMRIMFMDNGLIDYYRMDNHITTKEDEFTMIQEENLALNAEIQLLKMNKTYQKKIVREELGVIAQGEYLVVFAEEKPL